MTRGWVPWPTCFAMASAPWWWTITRVRNSWSRARRRSGAVGQPAQPTTRRSPLARSTWRSMPARTDSSVASTRTDERARVMAV